MAAYSAALAALCAGTQGKLNEQLQLLGEAEGYFNQVPLGQDPFIATVAVCNQQQSLPGVRNNQLQIEQISRLVLRMTDRLRANKQHVNDARRIELACRFNLADSLLTRNKFTESANIYHKILELIGSNSSRHDLKIKARAWLSLGIIMANNHKYTEAASNFRRAMKTFEGLGQFYDAAQCAHRLSLAMQAVGEAPSAVLRMHEQCLTLARKITPESDAKANYLFVAAEAYRQDKQNAKCLQLLTECDQCCRRIKYSELEKACADLMKTMAASQVK
jgi:tetratricopeptide (TPR) repeat protein